jgi:C4-dicarboxylate-specific signal transduction histidine kinase
VPFSDYHYSLVALCFFIFGAVLVFIWLWPHRRHRFLVEQQLKQMQENLAHLNRVTTLGKLAASITHELRQPLSAILGNAQAGQRFLSQKFVEKDELSSILSDIVEDDERAGQVIQHLRSLFANEEKRHQPVSVNDAVISAQRLLRSELIIGGISIETELDPEPHLVLAEAVQIEQVVINLILNSVEALKPVVEGLRRVRIETRLLVGEGVQLSVSDNGIGLPADMAEAVFEPFVSRKRVNLGMGMGLAICRSIIDSHGGRICLQSSAGSGTTVNVLLPLYEHSQPLPASHRLPDR